MVLFFCFACIIIIIYLICRNINTLRGLPPGPTPLPFIGNMLDFESDMTKTLLAFKKQYGDIFTIWMPQPHVVICSSQLLNETVVGDGEAYAGRVPPEEQAKLLVGGNYGLAFNDDSIWRDQRRFLLNSFRNQGFSTSVMQEHVTFLALRAVEEMKKKNGEPLEMSPYIMDIVGNAVYYLIYGKIKPCMDPELHQFFKQFDEITIGVSRPWFLALEYIPSIIHLDKYFDLGIKKIKDVNDVVLEYLDKEIQQCEASIDYDSPPKSYVDAYLHEMKRRIGSSEGLESFTRHQLKIGTYDVYGAGMAAPGTSLRYMFNYLINHPEIQDKLHAEIDRNIGSREPRMEDQKIMHYVNAFIQEIHRITNIISVNFARRVMKPVIVKGYKLPAGTAVIPQFQSIHLDNDIYERPDYFCPERYLNEDGEFVKDPKITPFSIGKRSCLGEPMAKIELFLTLIIFLQHFRFVPVGLIPPAVDVDPGLIQAPKPYQLRAIWRRH